MERNIADNSMEWLHFSDFHIGGARGPQAEALQSLIEKVAEICDSRTKIDAVFLAGDIAYSGADTEYTRFAEDFLVPLQKLDAIQHCKVFAVPGNHDVNCNAAVGVTWESIPKRNQDVFFCEDSDGRTLREFRARTLEAYTAFITKHNI